MTEADPPHRSLPVPESDDALLSECEIETFRAGGPGGQHQNRTESGVRITHRATGVQAVARDSRSQYRNRKTALLRLRRKLEKRNERKARRVPTSVPRREKRKRLEAKRRRSQRKKLRKPPRPDE